MKRLLSIILVCCLLLPVLPTVAFAESKRATKVCLGDDHSGALTQDGDLYLWGDGYYGQLGIGGVMGASRPVKVMSNVIDANLGGCSNRSSAITADGSLYMWGYNTGDQLGNGSTEMQLTPVKVMSRVMSVSLGSGHTAAITTGRELYMWGTNHKGQIGDGTTVNRPRPVKIMDDVVQASLSHVTSAAVTRSGALYLWGDNSEGQLGDGTTENHLTPVKIMDNVAAVSLGSWHSAAITVNGDLYMWGDNFYGQLGNGNTTDQTMPVKVMSNVAAVALGGRHSAAITTDGSLYMWGENDQGQVGNGTQNDQYTPTKVMSGVAQVSLGYTHSAALTEGGVLYVWGSNSDDKLGTGESVYDVPRRLKPTAITLTGVSTVNFDRYVYQAGCLQRTELPQYANIQSEIDRATPCGILVPALQENGFNEATGLWNLCALVADSYGDITKLGEFLVEPKDLYTTAIMSALEDEMEMTLDLVNSEYESAISASNKFVSTVRTVMNAKYSIDILDRYDYQNLTTEQIAALQDSTKNFFKADFPDLCELQDVFSGVTKGIKIV